ncbi:MAG: LysE family translocator [Gammaproteobacteria bacterium]|nr:MAG: LysE family translocator [Gammaproteobacteria bacterium]
MTDSTYWLVFFSAALALNISPGPDLIYILSRTIAQGSKVGLASAAGVCTGAFVHVLAVAFGLSAILMTSAIAFTVVKYLGAAYLVYLGIQALCSRGTTFERPSAKVAKVTTFQAYRQGVLVDVLNPKVAIFFMAFLPQFVRPDHGNQSLQLVVLGTLVIVVAIIVETVFVLAASRTTTFFRQHPKASVWLDRLLGSILVALGVRLAISDQ